MALAETHYEYIVLDEQGVPIIAGTTMKVIELALEGCASGWQAGLLHDEHPYLTLGQIHSALAYYWDHQAELDEDIQRRQLLVEKLRRSNPPSPLVSRLRERG